MPTKIARTLTTAIPLTKLLQVFSDKKFWEERALAIDPQASIDEFDLQGDKLTVKVTNVISTEDNPPIIRTFRPNGFHIYRLEKWDLNPENPSGSLEAHVGGAEISVLENYKLAAEGQHSTVLDVEGVITAKVPIFGPRIETGLVEKLETIMSKEKDFTEQWATR